MAFTPDGMFYLSQKDLQPSMDTLGTGFRGMLGLQNKEEVIGSILQDADYSTPEGRRAALDQIRQIDPVRWEELNQKNIDFEKSELEVKGMRGIPEKTTYFRTQVEPNLISNFVKDAINVEGISTFAEFSNYLDNLVAAGTIKTGERASKKSALKALLQQERKDWMSLNKYKSLEDIQAGYAPIGSNVTSFKEYPEKVQTPPSTPKGDSNPSLVDTYVNKPVGAGVEALGESGKTVLDYIIAGELQHDVLGKDVSDAINKYINQPISNLFK
jgi:hypothetical protein